MSPRGHEQNEAMRTEALAKITGAALRVFAGYGYHGATMKQIAKAAGLSYGLVYHYFSSKEQIFRHLVDFALEASIAGMQAFIDSPGTAWERIKNYSAMVVQTAFSSKSSLYFLIMHQAITQGKGISGLPGHINKRIEAYYEMFVPLIVQAQKTGEAAQGDPVVLAAAYFSFIQGLAALAFQRKGLEKKIGPEILSSVLKK
jgi:AcrR family transcriptional regulator